MAIAIKVTTKLVNLTGMVNISGRLAVFSKVISRVDCVVVRGSGRKDQD